MSHFSPKYPPQRARKAEKRPPSGAVAIRSITIPAAGDPVGLSIEAGGRLWTCSGYEMASGRVSWVHRPMTGAPMRVVTGRTFRAAAFPAVGRAEAPPEKVERGEPWRVGDTWTDAEGREWVCRATNNYVVWWEHVCGEEECGADERWWRSSGPKREPASAPVASYDYWKQCHKGWQETTDGFYFPPDLDEEGGTFFRHDGVWWDLVRVEPRNGYDVLVWRSEDADGVWETRTGRRVKWEKVLENMVRVEEPAPKVDTSFETYLAEVAEYSSYDQPSYRRWTRWVKMGRPDWDAVPLDKE